MKVEMTLTVLGDCPNDVRVGDKLTISGDVTVHTITGNLVDVTSFAPDGGKSYLPSIVGIDVYANQLTFAHKGAA